MSAVNFTLNAIPTIKSTCEPLASMPLVGFTHDLTSSRLRHGMLTTSNDVSRIYQENLATINYVNRQGKRIMPEGFHTTTMLNDRFKHAGPTVNAFSNALKASHHLHLLTQKCNIDHVLTWSFQCSDASFQAILLNEKNRLQEFAQHHFIKNAHLIDDALNSDHSIAFTPLSLNSESHDATTFFDKRTKQPLLLTKKQRRCLELAMTGLGAKQIALELHLSFRTIQHHLDAIRHNNAYASIKELLRFVDINHAEEATY